MIGAIATVGGLLVDGIGKIFGDKGEREKAGHAERVAKLGIADAVHAQFAAEFSRPGKTWLDSGVDALNRLPRPVMAFGVIWIVLVWPFIDPEGFRFYVAAIATVPDGMWEFFLAVAAFYFGARELLKMRERGLGRARIALSDALIARHADRGSSQDRTPDRVRGKPWIDPDTGTVLGAEEG